MGISFGEWSAIGKAVFRKNARPRRKPVWNRDSRKGDLARSPRAAAPASAGVWTQLRGYNGNGDSRVRVQGAHAEQRGPASPAQIREENPCADEGACRRSGENRLRTVRNLADGPQNSFSDVPGAARTVSTSENAACGTLRSGPHQRRITSPGEGPGPKARARTTSAARRPAPPLVSRQRGNRSAPPGTRSFRCYCESAGSVLAEGSVPATTTVIRAGSKYRRATRRTSAIDTALISSARRSR